MLDAFNSRCTFYVLLIYSVYVLLVTDFKVCTVSYGPSFYPFDIWLKREARRPYIIGEKRGSVTYSTDQEDEASEIHVFIISLLCVWRVQERFLSMRNRFKRSKAKQVNLKLFFKSLPCFRLRNIELKKVLNLYLLNKLRRFGYKSCNSLATQTALNFSGPCGRVRPAKLANHSVRTNLEILYNNKSQSKWNLWQNQLYGNYS